MNSFRRPAQRRFVVSMLVAATLLSGCDFWFGRTTVEIQVPALPITETVVLTQPVRLHEANVPGPIGSAVHARLVRNQMGCAQLQPFLYFSDGTSYFVPTLTPSSSFTELYASDVPHDPSVTAWIEFTCIAPFGSGPYDITVDVLWAEAYPDD